LIAHYFLDTSALVKYYHTELGTDNVAKLIEEVNNNVVISKISILEFHSQYAKKVRDTSYPRFNVDGFQKVCGLLCYHIVSGKYNVIELPSDFVFRATDLIRDHGCTCNLRHIDAIQISSYLDYLRLISNTVFVASDKKLLDFVSLLGFKCYDPET